ncbi:MAG TPA: ATP-binding protein [Thermoanaerobaculia bacterium]
MKTVESEIAAVLAGSISEITQRSIFKRLGGLARLPLKQLTGHDRQAILADLENSIRLFAPNKAPDLVAATWRALGGDTAGDPAGDGQSETVRKLAIEAEQDIASARLEAWSEAVRIGLSKFASVKVATAVSELARNIVFYASAGTIELSSRRDAKGTELRIVARDHGPGIEPQKLETIFAGTYKSERGLGKGLVAVQKLVDDFQIETRPGQGTTVSCVFRGER